MADWQAIKAEYITTDTSYRKLAAKYGVTYNVIGEKSREEGWRALRDQHRAETMSTILDADKQSKADLARQLSDTAGKLLEKVGAFVERISPERVDTQEFRHISGTLRDIKEVLMIRSEADLREQEARIVNLQRQAEKVDHSENESVTVQLEGVEEYAL